MAKRLSDLEGVYIHRGNLVAIHCQVRDELGVILSQYFGLMAAVRWNHLRHRSRLMLTVVWPPFFHCLTTTNDHHPQIHIYLAENTFQQDGGTRWVSARWRNSLKVSASCIAFYRTSFFSEILCLLRTMPTLASPRRHLIPVVNVSK